MSFVTNFLRGLIISISQLVPGVSGGTIAMVLGIYDKLLHAVNNLFKDFKVHFKLLLEVGLGAVVGVFLFSNIIKILLDRHPIILGYFFIGIILGGAPLMFKNATKNGFNKKNLLYLALGFAIVLFMKMPENDASSAIDSLNFLNFILLFISGIIIAIALILPGISGSFMLYILGLYNTVIGAITSFNIPILIPIVLGGIFGTFLSAKAIEKLLNKFPEQTYILIFGFILGSVFSVFPGFDGFQSIIGLIFGICGFIFSCFISIKA